MFSYDVKEMSLFFSIKQLRSKEILMILHLKSGQDIMINFVLDIESDLEVVTCVPKTVQIPEEIKSEKIKFSLEQVIFDY